MFGISGFEFLIIAGFILLVFGPEKIPDMAKTFGRAMKQFNQAKSDMETVIRTEMWAADQNRADSPFKPKENPLERLAAATKAQQPQTPAPMTDDSPADVDAEGADAAGEVQGTEGGTASAQTATAAATATATAPAAVASSIFEDDDEDEEEEE